jgi:signal peptidase I
VSLDVRPARRGQAVGALAAALVLIAAAGAFVLTAHRVIGASMTPTLRGGQLVLADPTDRDPDRFDLVVLRLGSGPDLVKRVIAVPGDRVEIEAAGPGAPFVRVLPGDGGPPLEVRHEVATWRSRSACCAPDGRVTGHATPAVVPPGRYFVLGDAPDSSIDSRAFGFTATGAVRATVLARMWPPGGLPASPWTAEPPAPGR